MSSVENQNRQVVGNSYDFCSGNDVNKKQASSFEQIISSVGTTLASVPVFLDHKVKEVSRGLGSIEDIALGVFSPTALGEKWKSKFQEGASLVDAPSMVKDSRTMTYLAIQGNSENFKYISESIKKDDAFLSSLANGVVSGNIQFAVLPSEFKENHSFAKALAQEVFRGLDSIINKEVSHLRGSDMISATISKLNDLPTKIPQEFKGDQNFDQTFESAFKGIIQKEIQLFENRGNKGLQVLNEQGMRLQR